MGARMKRLQKRPHDDDQAKLVPIATEIVGMFSQGLPLCVVNASAVHVAVRVRAAYDLGRARAGIDIDEVNAALAEAANDLKASSEEIVELRRILGACVVASPVNFADHIDGWLCVGCETETAEHGGGCPFDIAARYLAMQEPDEGRVSNG